MQRCMAQQHEPNVNHLGEESTKQLSSQRVFEGAAEHRAQVPVLLIPLGHAHLQDLQRKLHKPSSGQTGRRGSSHYARVFVFVKHTKLQGKSEMGELCPGVRSKPGNACLKSCDRVIVPLSWKEQEVLMITLMMAPVDYYAQLGLTPATHY